MNILQTLSQCLFVAALRVGLGFAQCDSIFYVNDGDLCYGMRQDASTDNCTDIPDIGSVEAFARNPVTEEFYVISYNSSLMSYLQTSTENPRFLYKFTASLADGVPVIDTPVQIGDAYTATAELLNALAFSCQGAPRLFALSSDIETTQYLYEVDYENSGNLTELDSFDISGGLGGEIGYGLFYNIERERLYKIAGSAITAYEIDPEDIAGSAGELLTYDWDQTTFASVGGNLFASYYNENFFFGATSFSVTTFAASLDNATFYNVNVLDGRTGYSIGAMEVDLIRGVECSDTITKCQATFSNAPSEQPSLQPSYVPSTDPSMMPSTDPSIMPSYMPSSDPSSMPTEMPVEAMMTTDDEVMADTTMEPESPEATEDSPEPTVADSASKNSISFVMVFVAAFGYLFY